MTYLIATELGPIAWREDSAGAIVASCLPAASREAALAAVGAASGQPGEATAIGRLLLSWLAGEAVDVTSPAIAVPGATAFQTAVRAVVRQIAAGTVLTYGEVAALVGNPRAARAVGQVMASNPVPPFVPCHRVVAAGGGLGGFGGGLALKRRLLALEGYPCAPS